MGSYTGFNFECEARNEGRHDLDRWFLDVFGGVTDMPFDNHPFFHTDRWIMCLRGSSSYHPSAHPVLDYGPGYFTLSIKSSLKNYDQEISKFLDFIYPHVKPMMSPEQFLGYTLREGPCSPDLLFLGEKRIITVPGPDVEHLVQS